jgi:hypothetical protein
VVKARFEEWQRLVGRGMAAILRRFVAIAEREGV